MPIYEYECAEHGIFELVQGIDADNYFPCPQCHSRAVRLFPHIAQIKAIHNERLPFNAPERVEDRHRILKDTSVKKHLADFKEAQRYSSDSPFKQGKVKFIDN